MKKKFLAPALFLAVAAVLLWASAAGGDSSDPLLSLSYLNGTFASTADTAIAERLDASDQALLSSAETKIAAAASGVSPLATASSWTESRLKSGDVLSGQPGLNVLVLAGSVRVTFPSGAAVDVTAGSAVASGTTLLANHRYMTGEDTAAVYTVVSPTAVVRYMGRYALTLSDSVDYNAIASALKTLHLFRGSYTGYGSGYDLELAPTRIQALIMFMRVLGEEDAALAYTGTTAFRDIARGSLSEKYVGYAVSKGYTNGYTATLFKPNQTVTVNQYTEFLLRAMGYSSTATTDLSDTLARARDQRRSQQRGGGGAGLRHVPAGPSGLPVLLCAGRGRLRLRQHAAGGADGPGRIHRRREPYRRHPGHGAPDLLTRIPAGNIL
jgi:hypothetical protein